jgi:predicted dehydrogenase
MLDAFAHAITTGAPFTADGAMGLRDVRIMEAVYASVAQGGKAVPIAT